MGLPVVAWDVDDVLNDLLAAWLAHWNAENLGRVRTWDIREITANPPHAVLGIPLEQYLQSLDAFRLAHAANLSPRTEVLRWFETHGERARHVAITSTSMVATPVSAAWVMRHFGRWIRAVLFVPALRKDKPHPLYDANKGELLARMGGADILVDDLPSNLAHAATKGIATLEWPCPWNSSRLDIKDTLGVLEATLASTKA